MNLHVSLILVFLFCPAAVHSAAADVDSLLKTISGAVSGDRARGYTERIWRYDRWSTLPMWQKSAAEARTIMRERGFDEAEVVNTPADGVTKFADWTNPIGWDVRQATLEVAEPSGLPEEVRFLCDYLVNPTSLTFFSCPTPPDGIVAELAVLDRPDPKLLESLNPKGKIILLSSGAGGMKRDLERCGALGVVSDARVGMYEDENVWLNTWSDTPGGWLMTAADARNTFCFSISAKKGRALRSLIAEGKKVRLRARIDSRYYTDDSFPYVTGCIKGTTDGEVLVGGHLFEWGAGDNAAGCAIILESVGVLNDLIRSGALPRPKRTIRVWMGQELYGSLAFAEKNMERLRRTTAAITIDTPAPDYDALASTVKIHMNPTIRPTFFDALYPELFRRYYASLRSNKIVLTVPFEGGTDTYFVEPLIGVPTTFVYMENGTGLHHNSRDTMDKVDSRSLRDLSVGAALMLYYTANAGFGDISLIAPLTFDRGASVILQKTREMEDRIGRATNPDARAAALAGGVRAVEYYTGLQSEALRSILRIMEPERRTEAERSIARYVADTGELGRVMVKRLAGAAGVKTAGSSVKTGKSAEITGAASAEAASLYPMALKIGTLTLEGIPPEEWRGLTSSARWWSPRNWAAASYWWCDGTRNLIEIREVVELEAGTRADFDFVAYYRFLEKHGLVTFVRPGKR